MKRLLGLALLVLLVVGGYIAQGRMDGHSVVDINTGPTGEIAIQGYDPVAYHTLGKPTLGNPDIAAQYHGATFLFFNEDHRTLFTGDPEKYLPAYGGFCSYGVTQRQKFAIDPQAWEIVDGVLYLQLDPGTRSVWMQDPSGNIERADEIWPEIQQVPAADL